jgi:hypothetical protein
MTLAALASDRRIDMVAVLPARIASTHGKLGDFLDRMRGSHRRWRLLPDGMYNIVLVGTKRSRIRCERPPTAARLNRIAEVELLKEAHHPEGSQELALQRAHVVDLFSELMRQLGRIDCTTRTHSTTAKTLF